MYNISDLVPLGEVRVVYLDIILTGGEGQPDKADAIDGDDLVPDV